MHTLIISDTGRSVFIVGFVLCLLTLYEILVPIRTKLIVHFFFIVYSFSAAPRSP
jgi:hypothetical protein